MQGSGCFLRLATRVGRSNVEVRLSAGSVERFARAASNFRDDELPACRHSVSL